MNSVERQSCVFFPSHFTNPRSSSILAVDCLSWFEGILTSCWALREIIVNDL
jgi:hypothetical protein